MTVAVSTKQGCFGAPQMLLGPYYSRSLGKIWVHPMCALLSLYSPWAHPVGDTEEQKLLNSFLLSSHKPLWNSCCVSDILPDGSMWWEDHCCFVSLPFALFVSCFVIFLVLLIIYLLFWALESFSPRRGMVFNVSVKKRSIKVGNW